MASKKTKWSTDEEIRVVLQTFNPETKVAELCREHNLAPRILYIWKEKFLEGGKEPLNSPNTGKTLKKHAREVDTLKKIIEEYAVANEALKKNAGRKQRMKAAAEARKSISLARLLLYCGISKTARYYTKRPRNVATDHLVETKIMEIAEKRPTHGTRRIAAQLARQSGLPVNRKKVARIYQKLGWSTPGRRKSEIIRSNKKVPKPTAPNQFWEADMSYIWCGRDGWCYSFNVIDVFTRQWLGFAFDTRATRHAAITSVNNAVASRKPDPGRLTIRVDNGLVHQPGL